MDSGERLWIEEPPEASAVEWARAYEMVCDLSSNLYDDDGELIAGTKVKVFVLEDALQRCETEAEVREPGIIKRRLKARLADAIARLEEFVD